MATTTLTPATQFTRDQYAEGYAPGSENHYWHLARNRILERHVRLLGAGRVLDIGCGRGIFVDYLNQRGLDCYGAELAEVEVPAHLRQRIFSGVAAENLPPAFRNSVEIIVLGDVIEHLAEPVAFLRSLLRAFPALKGFVLAVPARAELWSNYDEYYGHHRRYDLAGLHRTAEEAGLSLAGLQYMFRLLYPPARAILKAGWKRNTRMGSPGVLRIVHRIAAAFILADYWLLPAGVYGTSVICRATKLPGPEIGAAESLREAR